MDQEIKQEFQNLETIIKKGFKETQEYTDTKIMESEKRTDEKFRKVDNKFDSLARMIQKSFREVAMKKDLDRIEKKLDKVACNHDERITNLEISNKEIRDSLAM